MKLKAVLQKAKDPRGKQGQDYPLWEILNLIGCGLLLSISVHRDMRISRTGLSE